jgi:hypothetical protein
VGNLDEDSGAKLLYLIGIDEYFSYTIRSLLRIFGLQHKYNLDIDLEGL